ncbi:MAG: glucose-1-phosphate thymidylyltransferase RfbA [Nitrospinae bacterium]|nr:glucose-1-phosphate thymidylyltransferase RfbA [Nitrospinota bacterium]
MNKKGIILAGGSGTRLYPLTQVVSKQLMPVYDKPMIYYPLGVLMYGGITDILIITTPKDQPLFKELLGDGSQWGINLSYAAQPKPEGLAQALIIGEKFLAGAGCCLILGDNIFHGHGLAELMYSAMSRREGATIFGYWVKNPEKYGVVEFDKNGKAVSLEEKPVRPKSSYAVTGLYFYDGEAPGLAAQLRPSKRGELEITDLNCMYLGKGMLTVEKVGRGVAWLDTGSHESLLQAATYIETIEQRQGLKICCPEEIAYIKGLIGAGQLEKLAVRYSNNGYGTYLNEVLKAGRDERY